MANNYKIFPAQNWNYGVNSKKEKIGILAESEGFDVRGSWSLDKVKELLNKGVPYKEIANQFCYDCNCHKTDHNNKTEHKFVSQHG